MIRFENLSLWNDRKKTFHQTDLEFPSSQGKNKIYDCSEMHGLPVGVDLHVHFRDPGYPQKEDMMTGAKAALHGGITTVLDMPNTLPITDSIKELMYKKKLAEKQSWVEILTAVAITDKNIPNLTSIDSHCDAYKVFMSESFGKLSVTYSNIEKSLALLEECETSKPIIFHAEDPKVLEQFKNEKTHLKQRPAEAEAEAIQQIINWSHSFPKLHFHVTHLSSALGFKVLKIADLANLTSDTCPRYLLLDDDTELSYCYKKVNPPIRLMTDKIVLQEGFSLGEIDMICSDHSPHSPQEKEDQCPSGMPGVQELLPTVFSLLKNQQIEWERAIEAYHSYPSKLLNLSNNAIIDGNLIIVDLKSPELITRDWVKSKAGWSAFEGWHLFSDIRHVVRNNRVILE